MRDLSTFHGSVLWRVCDGTEERHSQDGNLVVILSIVGKSGEGWSSDVADEVLPVHSG